MISRLDARSRRSQQALLQSGLELLNSNPDATLTDIAKYAGVGRTTLYRQYETRDNLVVAIALYCFDVVAEVTAPIERQASSAMDAIRLLFEAVMPLTREFQFLMNLERLGAGDDHRLARVYQRQRRQTCELIEYGKRQGEITEDLPTPWIANLIDSLFIAGWLQLKEGEYSRSEVAAFAFASFGRGCRT